MRALLLSLTLLSAASPAKAECMSTFFVVSGNVVQEDQSPAAGVTVGVAWQEYGTVGGPALGVTDAQGHYSILVEFKPYSPTENEYRYECKLKLESVQVSSYSDTHRAIPNSVSAISEVKELQGHPPRILEIKAPPLSLLLKIDQPPFTDLDG